VERARLYGWSETLALDDDENECRAVSMGETGTLIIPPGGLAMAIHAAVRFPETPWQPPGRMDCHVAALLAMTSEMYNAHYFVNIL
jgi:hypothetical protein